ncbi:MAG: M6 family metalloprotease domain-containing protein [Deltaproteobacteria bacterium]|nr:M6 family metalloprotease domain-containing protein [Deltaproteobacteria bacterium]
MRRLLNSLLFSSVVLLGLSATSLAVPTPPFPIELKNEDGSSIMGRLMGDEWLSWAQDLAGFALAWDEKDGAWHYASLGDGGALVPTSHRAGQMDPRKSGLEPGLQPSPELKNRVRGFKQAAMKEVRPPLRGQSHVPNLVILVRFANQESTFKAIDYEDVFNASSGSVRDYYLQVSGGLLDLQSFVTEWIDLPENDIYYAYNERRYGNPEDMIIHATQILDDRGFDFTRFDADGDGVIDAVAVIHSGPGYETTGNSDYIHSHFSDLRWSHNAFTTSDGIRFVAYHTAPEFRANGRDITQIGVIVHETGHFFGLPDLYDYGYDSAGIGMWGLMASGPWGGPRHDGTVPTHFCGWSKMKLGFIDPLHITSSTHDLKLKPVERTGQAIVVDAGMPGEEYFLLENRQKTGYDSYIPGPGLLIYHVDDSRRNNDDQNHYWVDVEQADGNRDLNRSPYDMGDASDAFPLGTNTAFTPDSVPSSLPYDRSESIISVLDITRQGEDITFDLALEGLTEQSLSLLPDKLLFLAVEGKPGPMPKAFRLLHQGILAQPWQVQMDADAPWLSLSSTSGTSPSELMASVQIEGLIPGSYEAQLSFTSGDEQVILQVELDLSEPAPIISLAPGRLDFEAYVDLPPPATRILDLSNLGGGQLQWWTTAQADWIKVEPASGLGPSQLSVRVESRDLEFGVYESGILFFGIGARAMELPVGMVVAPENWPPEVPIPLRPTYGLVVQDKRQEMVASLASDQDGTVDTYNFVLYRGIDDWPFLTLTRIEPNFSAGEVRARPSLDLPMGNTYRWRVQAVDNEGLAGDWSEEVAFNLLKGDEGCACSATSGGSVFGMLWLGLGLMALRRRNNQTK